MERFLEGRRILVVDDDYFAAQEVKQIVESLGGRAVGPVGRLDQAESLVRNDGLDGAILDIRLDSHTTYSLASELVEAGVPVVFLTGFVAETIDKDFRDFPHISKPYDRRRDTPVLRRAFGSA